MSSSDGRRGMARFTPSSHSSEGTHGPLLAGWGAGAAAASGGAAAASRSAMLAATGLSSLPAPAWRCERRGERGGALAPRACSYRGGGRGRTSAHSAASPSTWSAWSSVAAVAAVESVAVAVAAAAAATARAGGAAALGCDGAPRSLRAWRAASVCCQACTGGRQVTDHVISCLPPQWPPTSTDRPARRRKTSLRRRME